MRYMDKITYLQKHAYNMVVEIKRVNEVNKQFD